MSIQKLWHEDGESGWKEALKNIVREAGEMFASVSISEIEQKEGHANYVTNIDREVEEFLQEKLLASEEKENRPHYEVRREPRHRSTPLTGPSAQS